MTQSKLRPARIVILGAGFAGIHTYFSLHKQLHGTSRAEIILVNNGDRFVFTPLIHEVATGTLLPSGITESLRALPQCCINDFIDGNVRAIDFDTKTVSVECGDFDTTHPHGHVPRADYVDISYDYLVVALGSETNFFDVPGAREHSLELKNLKDAKKIKNRVIECFERAERMEDLEQQRAALRFVIVGGGPTGVELVGELGDFLTGELASAFPSLADLSSIVIIERGGHLIGKVDPWFGARAVEVLKHKANIYTMTDTTVQGVSPNGVETSNGMVHAHTVVWAAGVRARDISITATGVVEREVRSNRIKVNEFLQVPQYQNVYVIGDMAWIYDKENEQPYPMRAQFAVREGKVAGRNIVHHMIGGSYETFHWKEKGLIISLGKGGAMAEVYGIRLTGIFAWVIYRVAYLSSLLSWRARLRTALEWLLNPFVPRDISKL